MRRLLIDANIYLHFFRFSNDDLDELRKVAELIRSNELELYVTQQIRDEVKRNRERVLDTTFKTVSDDRVPSRFPQVLRNYDRFTALNEARQAFTTEINGLLGRAREDAALGRLPADHLLEELMGLATDVPINGDVLMKAKERFDRGNPPGKAGKDRSYGDAITWEAVLAYHPLGDEFDIVTDDGDFRSPLRIKGLHEFLDDEWRRTKTSSVSVYVSLTDFLRTHFPNIHLSTDVASELAVVKLESSGSFAATHLAIAELSKLADFTTAQVDRLLTAALDNNQVGGIIHDPDVKEFYRWLVSTLGQDADNTLIYQLDEMMLHQLLISDGLEAEPF